MTHQYMGNVNGGTCAGWHGLCEDCETRYRADWKMAAAVHAAKRAKVQRVPLFHSHLCAYLSGPCGHQSN